MGEGTEEGITKAVAIDGEAISSRLRWLIALSMVPLFTLTMKGLEMLKDKNDIWIKKLQNSWTITKIFEKNYENTHNKNLCVAQQAVAE